MSRGATARIVKIGGAKGECRLILADLDSGNDDVPDAVEWALGTNPYAPLNPTQVPVYAWPVMALLLALGAYVARRRWPQKAHKTQE